MDSNHRPLGPELSCSSLISERFRISSDSGSNRVATRKGASGLPSPTIADMVNPRLDDATRRPACYATLRGATVIAMTLKARVKAGRLVVDEPTDLPEGTEIELLPLDPGDWLNEEDRAALHKALRDSEEDVRAGRLVDADTVLRELRSR